MNSVKGEPTATSTRKTAVVVGVLFLSQTITFIIADALIKRALDRPHYLIGASVHVNPLATGALMAFATGVATVSIALLLYPLLKHYSEPLALAYVAFRVVEFAAMLLYMAIPLVVIQIGDGLRDGTVNASAAPHLGALFQAQHTVAIVMLYTATTLDGTVLAFVLYRARLVPRWIAILGLIGYPVLLLGGILAIFNQTSVTHGTGLVAVIPGGLFELILPIWLLAKGFTFPRHA
jgi:hypothetical protein